eukprot:4763490-Alexandrium_andersonii.AAC.1
MSLLSGYSACVRRYKRRCYFHEMKASFAKWARGEDRFSNRPAPTGIAWALASAPHLSVVIRKCLRKDRN